VSGEPTGLTCPECQEPALYVLGPRQALCGNDGCRVMMWDPVKTHEEMLAEGVHEVDLRRHQDRDQPPVKTAGTAGAVQDTPGMFSCPCCGAVSPHPQDVEHGYCPVCHWWTGDPELGPAHLAAGCEARAARR
jgi:hypothetical protein